MANILNIWDKTSQKYVDIPAVTGKSAYQYAVDGGYAGTEEEFSQAIANFPSVPMKTSELTNDSGFLTEHQSLASYSTTEQVQQMITDATGYVESQLSGI